MSIVAITGGNGFLGQGAVEQFANAGYQVRLLYRSSHQNISDPNITPFKVNYDNLGLLVQAFEGVETVVHLADNAGRFTTSDDKPDLSLIVVSAMKLAGVRRVIFTSSIYARLNEEGNYSSYGAQKLAAEEAFSNESEIDPIFLRLPPVYGLNGSGGFALLAKLVAKKLPLPFGTATADRDYISLRNVSSLMVFLSKLDRTAWNKAVHLKFEPSDNSPLSVADLCKKIGHVLKLRPILVPIPKFFVIFISKVVGKEEQMLAAYSSLRVKTEPSLTTICGWRPIEKIPESLNFLSE